MSFTTMTHSNVFKSSMATQSSRSVWPMPQNNTHQPRQEVTNLHRDEQWTMVVDPAGEVLPKFFTLLV